MPYGRAARQRDGLSWMTGRFAPALGANRRAGGTEFRVWAPDAEVVRVVIEDEGPMPPASNGRHRMVRDADGYHSILLPGAGSGTRYRFELDGRGPFPDPASRAQPLGVHGPSEVVAWEDFPWTDTSWRGVPLNRLVLYELHVGTFTPEGTFAAAAARLPALTRLGVTAVELMPVADFPGARNWGYDGVAPFAPARCYGTPDDLRRFVDAAHALGLAVHLDVVYNHFGPDGAYQSVFGRDYYSSTHHNTWGKGLNFDGPRSRPVRAYVIENALRWVHEFHVDGLRLDATHAIEDASDTHVLAELAAAVHGSVAGTRVVQVIAEDSRNLNTIVRPSASGGWGLDAVWSDDFHHHVRRALGGDADGYFADFDGSAAGLASTARQGWFYTGQMSAYQGVRRGTDPSGIEPAGFVFCLQNHDQVGNRAMGDRFHHRIDLASWRAASLLLLVLPETPLIFMGQEWAAGTPFCYFTDHEPELGRLVTEGRRREFARFRAFTDPAMRARIPDPQDPATFEASRLNWEEREEEPHAGTLRLYTRLLELRRLSPAMQGGRDDGFEVEAVGGDALLVRRGPSDGAGLLAVVRLRGAGEVQAGTLDQPGGARLEWRPRLTTEDDMFTADPRPPAIGMKPLTVTFERPGGAIFEASRGPAREDR